MPDFEIDRDPADDIPWTMETSDNLPHPSPGNGAQPKASTYAWVTWMSKIIAGEAFCEWSLSFRARYSDKNSTPERTSPPGLRSPTSSFGLVSAT